MFSKLNAPLLTGVFILLYGSISFADECTNPQTQMALSDCAARSLEESDASLNLVYGELRKRLADDPDTTELLVNSQRNWMAFRDAECEFSSSGVRTGSAYPLMLSTCLDQLTQQRTSGLKVYLKCVEGDMGCPIPPEN